jgi:predicted ribosome quality control (RQC) complex YloA/Tae2 family protein
MVLRKHLSQAYVHSIEQMGFDRIVRFELQGRNEFSDLIELSLYAEIMGKYANLVLVSQEGIIIDALKRIPVFENSKRLIFPGAQYTLPEQPDKQDPLHPVSIDMEQSLVSQFQGFSPLISREFFFRLSQGQTFEEILQEIFSSRSLYVYDAKNFHVIELKHLNKSFKQYELMSGLNQLYIQSEKSARMKESCADVYKCVERELKRLKKKKPKLEQSLNNANDYEKYKEYGDLIFAYMYQIEREPVIELESFETGKSVKIALDMRYDLKTNANLFYKKYHKLKRGQAMLEEQILQCEEEIEYFEQLSEQLKHCSISDAQQIRAELVAGHYMFEKKGNTARKKSKNIQVLTLLYEGATIYVGKNNLQNNYITHQISRKQDYWFHVKDYHGSHVLLKSEELNEDLIRFCANLAAYFSRSSQGSSVPVDYTQISQLKKVPGSKIGFVTMKSYKTIYIDPDLEQIASWIDQYRIKK